MEQEATQGDSGGDRRSAEEMARRIWKEIQTNRMVPEQPGELIEKTKKEE